VVNNITGGTTTVTGTTLMVTGNDTGGNITANNSTVDIEGQMTGGTVTLNSSVLMVGSNPGPQSAVGGTIVYGTGIDSVDLANITSITNSTQLLDLNDGDSIAESNIPFNSATLSGTTLTLKEGATTVATFNDVTVASGASHTFEPVTTELIGGKTYYVATLDPPTGSSGTGATGASGDPLKAPIHHNNVLGNLETVLAKFLQGTGTKVPPGDATGPLSGNHDSLTPTLPSRQLLADLTNIGKVVDVLKHGSNDPGVGSGHQTTPNVTGIGSALGNHDNGGKPEFKDLITHNPTIVPRH
jgi:hypothetical protein